jgi:hemerythrin-like domain-containing protein
MSGTSVDRRRIVAGIGSILSAGSAVLAAPKAEHDADEGVTAPEDLMKEHGVLNRCLLIYEEGLRRLHDGEELTPQVFNHTAQLVRKFVEQYHEKNEEKYIFPVFERARKHVDLVQVLKEQHRAGRTVTEGILRLTQPEPFRSPDSRSRVVELCHRFIRMYRPHEAREDTVLFPALRTILTPKQVEALGERMEEDEHKVLGDEGFERSVAQVAVIEKQLAIYDLKQFTPHA